MEKIIPRYNYRNPLRDIIIKQEDFVYKLLSSKPVQRLKKLSFLGSIDLYNKHVNNISYYSRYDHSLGVCRLAIEYAEHRNIDYYNYLSLIAAAVLHDIGHFAFSHSAESLYKKYKGIDHHEHTEFIIRNDSELLDIFHEYKLDNDYIIDIINGKESAYEGLFSDKINIDTIDAICRVNYSYKLDDSLNPIDLLYGKIFYDFDKLDKFWMLKNNVYENIIQSEIGAYCDNLMQNCIINNLHKFKSINQNAIDKYLLILIPELHYYWMNKNTLCSLHNKMINISSKKYTLDKKYKNEKRYICSKKNISFVADLGKLKNKRGKRYVA